MQNELKTCKNCDRVENGQIIYWDEQGNCVDCGRSKDFYTVDKINNMNKDWRGSLSTSQK